MPKTTIINYGAGNLYSISTALRKVRVEVMLADKPLGNEDLIVLPGVGNFKSAMKRMGNNSLIIIDEVREGKCILGICLGMQLLFEWSEEGYCDGLGILGGKVVELPNTVKKPHIGWSPITVDNREGILKELGPKPWVYFNHSYYPQPQKRSIISATAIHGIKFPAVIEDGNIMGTQFHPEKSGEVGAKILRNIRDLLKR